VIDLLSAELGERSAAGVARAVAVLAGRGDIPAGSRLPTVREVARALQMSSSTVGEAWRLLATRGIVQTEGRRGTFLRRAGELTVRNFRHINEAVVDVDLSTGYPDPALLPDLRPLLRQIADGPPFVGSPTVELDEELRGLVEALLPYSPGSVLLGVDTLATMGALLPTLVRFGDRVVVGSAEFAPYLDLIERGGLEMMPVPFDDEGFELESVQAALDGGARLVLVQPRVHSPTGRTTTPRRLAAIAQACREHDAMILEVDHFGELSSRPALSAAESAPERTLTIRVFSKDLHPDVRICALAGPPLLVNRLQQLRVGSAWLSPAVNRRLLAELLASKHVTRSISRSKAVYDDRRTRLVGGLIDRGLDVRSQDGFNVWVPVRSEEAALLYLVSRGIGAAPGAPFRASPAEPPHIRVSIGGMGRIKALDLVEAIATASNIRRLGTS